MKYLKSSHFWNKDTSFSLMNESLSQIKLKILLSNNKTSCIFLIHTWFKIIQKKIKEVKIRYTIMILICKILSLFKWKTENFLLVVMCQINLRIIWAYSQHNKRLLIPCRKKIILICFHTSKKRTISNDKYRRKYLNRIDYLG